MENKNAETTSTKFATFALLDLETCNLPMHNHNRTAITELCIYGFAAKIMSEETKKTEICAIEDDENPVPAKPRVLHKLTLLLNPAMTVHPESESITGLNNYILEEESRFDDNAAETVLGFLKHLQQPVCLVAHNGWGFDFPIIKQTFEKLQKQLPTSMVCVDSLRAFLEIDKKRKELIMNASKAAQPVELPNTPNKSLTSEVTLQDALNENSQFNWRQFNESTPKRPPSNSTDLSSHVKRKLLAEASANLQKSNEFSTPQKEPPAKKPALEEPTTPVHFKSRRSLNFGADASPVFKKYPPRGVYKLGDMFQRIFKQAPVHAHHAEADVDMLLRLLLHYGEDFVSYAEQHAKPFSDVPRLGRY